MGCDCNCTWKCARTTFGVIYGVVGILEVFLVIQFYFTGRPEYHSINLKSPSESIFQLLKLFAMLPGCIALLYSIKKVDAKFMTIVFGFIIFQIFCDVLFMIYYILVTGNDIVEVFADCLLHSLSLYIMHKIRDDILAEKSQLPPVYYDPEPIPSGRTPYPQLPQQDQQSFVPANPYYAQLPQQYSPVPANSSFPPTMQPQPSGPNMCPPLPQPSAPFNQLNNV